tara:strand:- start:81 stop:494 length:414 start_codon:yes stop_codon:yes gene_type:complete
MSNARILADYVSSGEELADKASITSVTLKAPLDSPVFTGTTTIPLGTITQTDAQNLTGTYSTHEMIVGNTFTLTGDVTVNENIVLANFTKSVTEITVQPDATARTITSTGGTGVLEGGSLMEQTNQSSEIAQWLYEE